MSIPLKAKMRQRALKRDLEGVYILWTFVYRMRTKKNGVECVADRPTWNAPGAGGSNRTSCICILI